MGDVVIDVLPNLSMSKRANTTDPDVDAVKNKVDLLSVEHEQTNEEKNTSNVCPSKLPTHIKYIIVIMAFVIVTLVVLMALYFIKKDKNNTKPKQFVPSDIFNKIYPKSKQNVPQHVPQHTHQHVPQQMYTGPPNTHVRVIKPNLNKQKIASRPSKAELESELKSLSTIMEETNDEQPEQHMHTPVSEEPVLEEPVLEEPVLEEPVSEEPDKQDKLTKQFYDTLSQNAEIQESEQQS